MSAALKKRLKHLLRNTNRDIKAVEGTGLFQADWYVTKYPDVLKSSFSPIEHYVRLGEAKGYKPNPYFDPKWYVSRAPGSKKFPGPALVHYAVKGWKNDKSPSRDFWLPLYFKFNPDIVESGVEPLRNFLMEGWRKGRVAMHRDLEKEKNVQVAEDINIIAKSGLFNAEWYRNFHTDMWDKEIDFLMHYVLHGAQEGRNPNPFFQTQWYRDAYQPSVGDANPLAFYVTKGAALGHWPAPNFSPELYYKENPDLNAEKSEALAHYIHFGLREKRRLPSPGGQDPIQGSVVANAKLPVPEMLRTMVDYERRPLAPDSIDYDSTSLNIHWVIPDFSPGAGGHMTIFRMTNHLEMKGHRLTIWINGPTVHKTPDSAYEDIVKHFQHFAGDVKFVDDSFEDAKGDIIIATDCWTVWPTLSVTNFKRRFYFVQDFEPSFHAMGSAYLAAERTYHEDIDCICASPWLSKLMQEKYGRWARPFWLAADQNIYTPPAKPRDNAVPRIAFYARHFTARRAVELAMLALEELAKRYIAFEVDFFGAPLKFKTAPFPFVDHGVATPHQLAALFQGADVGVVFSATNYSLVPQEMMACNLPIVELRGENTTCIFPEETVSMADPDPLRIADALEKLLTNPDLREKQAAAAFGWVKQFSWQASATLVESALLERLAEFGKDTAKEDSSKEKHTPKASVVIPTLNAGPILDHVLEATTQQLAPWPYEILVIDSGSTDETLDIVRKYPDVRLHQIDKKDFNHGDTRNLGVELTSGEFIAFLTHDALPANNRWLHNLVTSIEHYPGAAGAFGKHLPWPDASEYTKRDLNAHFDLMLAQPLYLDKDTHKKRFDDRDTQWMQLLHFYSDNNSCMRRSVWEKIPYRRTKFGEDQLWAYDIIRAGYGKVYAAQAVVYHSHDFDAEETRERNRTESAFFNHFFGYKLIKNEKSLKQTIKSMNAHDAEWGKKRHLPKSEIKLRQELNAARLQGYLEGAQADTSGMF